MTFEFSKLPFTVAMAYLAFAETIDLWTWVGALVIFASAVYITRREAQLSERARVLCREGRAASMRISTIAELQARNQLHALTTKESRNHRPAIAAAMASSRAAKCASKQWRHP